MTRILVTIFAVALFGLYSSLARADSSDPTRGFRGTNLDNQSVYSGGQIYPAPKTPTSVYEGLDWNRDQTFAFNPGVTTPAKELVEQIKRNEAARGQYDDYSNAPFEYSAPFLRAFQQGGSD